MSTLSRCAVALGGLFVSLFLLATPSASAASDPPAPALNLPIPNGIPACC